MKEYVYSLYRRAAHFLNARRRTAEAAWGVWAAGRHRKRLNARVHRHGRTVASLARAAEPRVLSILIPAYSAHEYIGECLASIQSQQSPPGVDIEILVGVDGCRKTQRAVNKYLSGLSGPRTQNTHILFFPRRYGAYVIRNSLLWASRGEHVQFVDADDALAPDMLPALWQSFLECQTGSCAYIVQPMGIYCNAALVPKSGDEQIQIRGAIGLSKGALKPLGGFAPWVCAADADFLRRAEVAGIRVKLQRRPSYYYRIHGDQLSRSIGTGLKSQMRAYYWGLIEARIHRRHVREPPVVAREVFDYTNEAG